MRELFDIIKNNYDPNGKPYIRPSVRGIIIKEYKIAVVHSMMYDYYKFPGGGIDKGEDNIATLIREVKEEAGLDVIVDSIREYGHVLRKEKGHPEDIFIQDNYYYLCDTANTSGQQILDDYESRENFTLEWADPLDVIAANDRFVEICKGFDDNAHINKSVESYRESRVMKMLVDEGYFS